MALSMQLLIFMVIEIIMYLFHFSLLILMIAKRKDAFKGPFYNLFRIVLFAECMLFILLIFSQKMSLFSFLMEYLINNPYAASLTITILPFFTMTQFLGHLFMAFNRFTLFWFPIKHEKIWKRQWYTVIILGIPLLNISWRLHEPAVFVFGANDIVWNEYLNNNVTSILNVILTTTFLSTTCLAALFNILTIFKFFAAQKQNVALKVNEKNLLYVSFIIFIAQLLRISYNVVRIFFMSNVQLVLFFTTILPYLNDIFAWSGSISLLFLSSSTRQAYKSFYFCKIKTQQRSPAISMTSRMFPSSTLP